MSLKPEVLEADFKVSAVGTLVTGQWFAKNANISKVSDGEYPLLLVTGGVLNQVPSLLPKRPSLTCGMLTLNSTQCLPSLRSPR